MSVPASTPDPTAGISEQLNKQTGRYANHLEVERDALTPMMRHYADVKDQYPQAILLYRVGDFFETFFQDAITVARELELVLTSKDCGKDLDKAFMAGIPHHALERYCTLLVDKGYAVAVCDQVEDPAVAQGLVRREVTRVITPGTVLEEGMLQARRNNFLAAIVLAGNHWGLAYADVSTGEFFATQSVETLQNKSLVDQLIQELFRLQPSEVLLPTNAPDLVGLLRPGEKTEHLPTGLPPQFCYTLRPQLPFSLPEARHRLLTRFRLRSLEGLGCNHLPLVIRAAGGLLEYLEETWEREKGKVSGDRLQVSGDRSQVSGDNALPTTSDSALRTPHSTLATPAEGQRTKDNGQPSTPHSALHTPHSALQTPHSTLHTPHSTLHTPHSALHTPHSTLHTPHSIPLQLLRTYTLADYLTLDHQTRRNLEIIQTVRDGTLYGSLLWAIDRTVTAMGGRALRRWLLQPLLSVPDITARQDTIQELVENLELRQRLQSLLKDIYDLERLTGRAGSGTANARDLVALAESFGKLPELADLVAAARSPHLTALQQVPPHLEQLGKRLRAHLTEAPPLYLTEGNLIRPGVNPQLDELRQQVEADQQWIANLEVEERATTGIPNLKVSYNKTFGYYISISRNKADQVPVHYIRKQTLSNEERYITPDLKEREARILSAQDDQKRLEYDIFADLRREVGDHASTIRTVARSVAAADVLCGLAEVAVTQGYCRPHIVAGRTLAITDGRHPVVEQSLPAGFFVPNSAELGDGVRSAELGVRSAESSEQPSTPHPLPHTPHPTPHTPHPDLIILTGPNASGKSCYLRQVGLIQLLAQVGSFVPATSAVLGVCDRIFTRVGAVDDLATGQSTFMVEMNETANILNHATERSLVLLDEIGRGTATFDGLSIAWAVAEYLAAEIRARTIFATHYHELNELASILPNVANYQVTVKELPDQIIFLHQVRPGGADRSYGIEAGRLAGLPPSVIQRARQVMTQIEKHSRIAIGLRKGNPGNPTVREKSGREKRQLKDSADQPTKQLGIFDG